MDDDSRVVDRGWDALPDYSEQSGEADEAVTVSISTTPGEWLVNTVDSVVVPMSMAEVVEALRHHKLTLRSLVWRAGMQEWAPVDRVPQLKLAARMAPSREPPAAAPLKSAVVAAPTKAVTASVTQAPTKAITSSVAPAPATTTPLGPPPPARSSSPTLAKPSKPTTKTIPPSRSSTPAPQALNRRATLPFGLPTSSARSSSPLAAPRPAIPPAEGEDTEVLAVYERPAATISFDLAPVEPKVAASPYSAPAPQTLAPTTTDAAPRTPRSADLSVVAASQFRDVQRSSKRIIVISSIASAAAASLLTFLLSHRAPETPVAARAPEAAPALKAAAPVEKPVAPTPEAAPVAVSEPAPSAAPVPQESAPKPKRRAKTARVAPPPRPVAVDDQVAASPRSPSEEPNPYDVKLEDDAAPAKPTPSHGSGLDDDGKGEASAASANPSPGF